MAGPGIDYGYGTTNIDRETGIRYGVIHQNEVLQTWCDSAEADYGEPTCGHCGNEARKTADEAKDDQPDSSDYELADHALGEYACDTCERLFDGEDAFGDEPNGFILDDGEYKCESGSDGDIFVLKSPYYTTCAFCSPCAPGAGYLTEFREDGIKAYCFGHDWFDDGKAPYKVFKVADGSEVEPPVRT